VKVVNEGTGVLEVTYGGVKRTAKPGGEMYLEWAAAIKDFGDPYLRDTEKWRARADEWDRIRTRYGAYSGLPGQGTVEELIDRNAPKVRVLDQDGNVIPMVLNDPEGENAPNRAIPPNIASADVDVLLEYQRLTELRLAELERVLAEKRQEPATTPASDGPVLPDEDDAAPGVVRGEGITLPADDDGPATVDAPPAAARRTQRANR